MSLRLFAILSSLLLVSGCVSQDQADAKMARGCVAGINALLTADSKEISEVKAKRYAQEETEGGLHRRITIEAIEKEGWLELDKSYSCLFMQEWGLFKSSHRALLVQIKIEDQIYGKKDGTIIGNFDDFLALTKAVDGAMAQ